MHDYEHTGCNNDFLVATAHPLALRYNDKSPSENHHSAAAFAALQRPENNFLAHLPKQEMAALRKLVRPRGRRRLRPERLGGGCLGEERSGARGKGGKGEEGAQGMLRDGDRPRRNTASPVHSTFIHGFMHAAAHPSIVCLPRPACSTFAYDRGSWGW